MAHSTPKKIPLAYFRRSGRMACGVIVRARLGPAAAGSGAGKQPSGWQLQSRVPGQAGPNSAGRKRSGSIFAPGSLLGTPVPKRLPGTRKLPVSPAGPGTAGPGAAGGARAAVRGLAARQVPGARLDQAGGRPRGRLGQGTGDAP
jgi:hypothetical protein